MVRDIYYEICYLVQFVQVPYNSLIVLMFSIILDETSNGEENPEIGE